MGLKVKYNGVQLETLGKLRKMGEEERPLPDGEFPNRIQKIIRIRIDSFEDGYAANRAQIETAIQAFKATHAPLEISDGETTAVYCAQDALLMGSSLPQDPNEWGTTHAAAEISFSTNHLTLVTQAMTLSYQPTGATEAVSLGMVEKMKDSLNQERFHGMRAHRRVASGSISLSGIIMANPLLDLLARRAAMIAEALALKASILAVKDGVLKYGTHPEGPFAMNRTVKVERFDADVNQAATAIEWSLNAVYTEFPNEAGYAVAEVSIRNREDIESGQMVISLSGKVGAQTEAAARAQLAIVRAAYLPADAGNTRYAQTRGESVVDVVRADTDGEAFIELKFDEEWRKAVSAIVSWTRKLVDQEDARSGLVRRTYTGQVTASSKVSWGEAYKAAVAHARLICAGGATQVRVSSVISAEDPQLTRPAEVQITSAERFCKVDFTFEYQLKGSAVWVEVTSGTQKQLFGVDTETVSGFATAATQELANREYEFIRGLYSGRMVREERVDVESVRVRATAGVAVGATVTPPESGVAGAAVNAGETTYTLAGTNPLQSWVEQSIKVSFSFTVHTNKNAGGIIGLRWALETTTDYIARLVTKSFSGSIFASSSGEAAQAVELLANQMSLTGVLLRERTSSNEDGFVQSLNSFSSSTGLSRAMTQFEFSREHVAEIASNNGVLIACRFEETVRHSGPRWVVKPTAFGRDVLQQCGYQSGERVIRAEVIASDEATGVAWLKRQYWAPFNTDIAATPGTRRRQPPTISGGMEHVPLTDGVARSGTWDQDGYLENVLVYRGTIEASEFLPDSDYLD